MTNPLTTFDPPLAGPPVLEPTDVSYVLEDTEVGRLLVAVRDDGAVVTCAYAGDPASEDRWLQRIAAAVSPRVLRHPAPTDAARRALAAYLSGDATSVDVRAERTTYAVLASAVDHPGAARAVGTALGANPLCIVLPCHRVLPASGGVGGYAGGPAAKEHLLALEAAHAA